MILLLAKFVRYSAGSLIRPPRHKATSHKKDPRELHRQQAVGPLNFEGQATLLSVFKNELVGLAHTRLKLEGRAFKLRSAPTNSI